MDVVIFVKDGVIDIDLVVEVLTVIMIVIGYGVVSLKIEDFCVALIVFGI